MFRFDYHCKNCGYSGEKIVNHSSDPVDCPLCQSPLEKSAGGFNISTSKTRPKDAPDEIMTSLGRAEHVASFEFKNEAVQCRANLYRVRNPRMGDPEMN